MQLSTNFALDEAVLSQTAIRKGIDNDPDLATLAVLRETAENMELVRTALGNKVITISSWYRCPELNKAVGGAKTSSHLTGEAVDFNCFAFGAPLEVAKRIAASGIKYDQLIHEYGRWVHIGFGARMRQQQLTVSKHGTVAGLYAV